MVVFRPFAGEVLTGKIKSCSPSGVVGTVALCLFDSCSLLLITVHVVTMGFFDDILIPGGALQTGSKL